MIDVDGSNQMLLTAFISSLAFEAVSNFMTSAKCLIFFPSPGSHSGDAGRAAAW